MQHGLQPQSTFPVGGELALQQQRVLRNTYMLLALTMVPTVVGALIGMRTGGIIMQHPIIATLVMLGAVIGLQFAIAVILFLLLGQWADRKLGTGPVFLLIGVFIGGGAAFFSMYRRITAAQKADDERRRRERSSGGEK